MELFVHQNAASGVKQFMNDTMDTMGHVPPIRLWQALCGGAELPTRQYQHIIHCVACETLATQIGDALDDIEDALRRNRIGVGRAAQADSRLS